MNWIHNHIYKTTISGDLTQYFLCVSTTENSLRINRLTKNVLFHSLVLVLVMLLYY